MELHIKNMVSLRCIIVVKAILDELGLGYKEVLLGKVKLVQDISDAQYKLLQQRLLSIGLDLLEERRHILVEKIIHVILEMVHGESEPPKTKHSVYISEKLHYEYSYLSKMFTDVTGVCIEQFMIAHRIEKAKELMAHDELNLSEIAWRLHYCSVQHFSHQFKKVTGYPPSEFKRMQEKPLFPLEHIGAFARNPGASMNLGRAG